MDRRLMAISHICLDCGTDLALVRAVREPIYRLSLVICPECGRAAVRERHPILAGWRAMIRLSRSIGALIVQLALLVIFLGSLTAVSVLVVEYPGWFLGGASPDPFIAWLPMLIVIGPSVVLGVWIGATLPHWRAASALFVLGMIVAGFLTVDTILMPSIEAAIELTGSQCNDLPFGPDRWLLRLGPLAAMLLMAATGVPVGRLVSRGYHQFRVGRWRARRRRLRARRRT